MEERVLDGLQVAILATDGVEEIELTDPREALERAGARTMLLAPKAGEIQAMKHAEKAGSYRVDMTIDKAHPDEFDAVLLPGGTMNADKLRVEKAAQDFVRKMDEVRKPIAAICHAPWLLVSAGVVKLRRLTSYHTIQDDVRNAGGMWEDREVVVDVNWVTSRAPKDLPAFDREMLALFSNERAKAQERAKAEERAAT
jgi:protease I